MWNYDFLFSLCFICIAISAQACGLLCAFLSRQFPYQGIVVVDELHRARQCLFVTRDGYEGVLMKIHHWGLLLLALCIALAVGEDGGWTDTVGDEVDGSGSARLVFFQRSGPYLPAVDVQVRNEAGRALVATTIRGPWLVVSLPEGRYIVRAKRESGETRSARFRVEAGQRREVPLRFVGVH
jgi:hypothetical protein